MNLYSSLRGTVTASLTGADITGTLDLFARRGVPILHCQFHTELEAVITLRRADYRQVKLLCGKRGDTLKLKKRSGIYWTLKALLKRPVLTFGALFYLVTALYLPSRVLFVRVVGNSAVPTRLILEAAADCGIGFGASRREVRSERMKNALLEAVPQLQWAGVNTYGCVAEISVRERAQQEAPAVESSFGHIVASREGIITSCNATRGNLLCAPGQAVEAGDILISGYTDCGLTIRAEQAQGEVFAATRRELTVITPDSCLTGTQNGEEKKKISLLIGKKRINFWKDSGIWDTTCDRMYEEYYITLPGGFQLPFGWCVERYRPRTLSETELSAESREQLLQEAGAAYLKEQMLSGAIRDSVLTIDKEDGYLKMTGQYSCVEMIGFMQRQEIGETNGETD